MGITHTLMGGCVGGRPDYVSLLKEPRINSKLTLVAVEVEKGSAVCHQIREAGRFSLNLFSGKILNALNLELNLAEKLKCSDYRCKSFYGSFTDAPMLEDAPLSLECLAYDLIELENSIVVMGEIAGRWSGSCSLDGTRSDEVLQGFNVSSAGAEVLPGSAFVV